MISIFDLFSIGIGPSSSHTVGPMRAAHRFVQSLKPGLDKVSKVEAHLYGSLALTGFGHGTHTAVLLGLMGELPESVDPETATDKVDAVYADKKISLDHTHTINFDPQDCILWHKDIMLDFHSNGVTFKAFDVDNKLIKEMTLYSVGGGFIVSENEEQYEEDVVSRSFPYPFETAAELATLCLKHDKTIAEIAMANECVWRDEADVRAGVLNIWSVMDDSIHRGCNRPDKLLPGGLNVRRRAATLYQKLQEKFAKGENINDMDWLSVYAIAINEENAACKRIVTAPTNGAAGIIPAVLKYHLEVNQIKDENIIVDYLLTAAVIGYLYKHNASISAAEVGCQGEVGVACSMAAAGLAAIMGGNVAQVHNAAEMGMEHSLGLTCDPIGGLVQIPCIERNAMGSVQAVNSARLALLGDGEHFVSLDKVIQTMFATGRDMSHHYKETALGGLAVNQPAC